jgi:UMF1 family MFS transporter
MEQSDRRTLVSWCMYDWANSAFNTLVITFFYSAYFSQVMAPDTDRGMQMWAWAISASGLLIAILSPILGTVADRSGRRRRYMILFSYVCIAFTVLLTFVSPTMARATTMALIIVVIANVSFELAVVFYNAYLPSLVPRDKIGRLSGYGWGLGYAGGLVCLAIAFYGFVGDSPRFGISTVAGFNIRATNLLVAGWFLLFSIPMFLFVRDEPSASARVRMGEVLEDLKRTFRDISQYRDMARFLIARLVYNDGLVTVIAFASIYAAGTFHMTFAELSILGIVLNLLAGLGAWVFGFVDDRIGGKKTIMITLVALSVAVIVAVLAPTKTWFWAAGVLVGIFLGPNQSASRSLMGRFVPAKHAGEFFGFFAFSGKVTSFLGPLVLGFVAGSFGQRAGVSTVLIFFVVGGLLLSTVNEQAGIEASAGPDVISGVG